MEYEFTYKKLNDNKDIRIKSLNTEVNIEVNTEGMIE